jgi:hypothetical protein
MRENVGSATRTNMRENVVSYEALRNTRENLDSATPTNTRENVVSSYEALRRSRWRVCDYVTAVYHRTFGVTPVT